MNVFVTGASGFIGSAIIKELIKEGHHVRGLARSENSAGIIRSAGAEVVYGDLNDPESLKKAAFDADGIIHTAFSHDFLHLNDMSKFPGAVDTDRKAIDAMAEVLEGTEKAMVVTTGISGLPLINGMITEESTDEKSFRTSEATALSWAKRGVRASVVRLAPSVHDVGDYGFVPVHIKLAREKGVAAYPGNGNNRWTAIHRADVARLFRLAVEKGTKGAVYNGIAENAIDVKNIAELIGRKLNVPVQSVSGEEINEYFDWMSRFISADSPATNLKTKEQLGWEPVHIGLLQDMEKNYF